jgi:hypothetical protein
LQRPDHARRPACQNFFVTHSAPLIPNQLGKRFAISGIKNFDEYMNLYRSSPCWEAPKNSLDAMRWI